MEPDTEVSSQLTSDAGKAIEIKDRKLMLSTLWIFAVLNYIYADVFTAIDPVPNNGSVPMTHGFMLGAAVLMETAIIMIPLSRILKQRPNRWANIIVGVAHTSAVLVACRSEFVTADAAGRCC